MGRDRAMVPTKKGAKDGKKNSPRNSAVKILSLRGEGRRLRPTASVAPN